MKNRIIEKKGGPFSEVSEGGENGNSNGITVDAEDDLVDAMVEGHLGDHMVATVAELDEGHSGVGLPRSPPTNRAQHHPL